MILNRLGNKKKIAEKVHRHVPQHDLYIELFFGAGGMFVNKPLAKYNIVNDLDDDVYNLYQVIWHRPNDLIKAWHNPRSAHCNFWPSVKNRRLTLFIRPCGSWCFPISAIWARAKRCAWDLVTTSQT